MSAISDLQAAVDALQAQVAGLLAAGGATGPAGGDLAGTYPNPIVEDITLSGGAHGDVYYRGSAGLARLGAGTNGQILKTGGAGADPSWLSLPEDIADVSALEALIADHESRLDAVEADGGGVGESYHKLINILDYEADTTDILDDDDITVIGQNWAVPFMNAIADAVSGGLRGVFIPAREAPYLIGKRGPLIQDSIDLDGRSDLLFLGEGDGSWLKLCGSGNTRAWNMFAVTNATNISFARMKLDGGRDSGSAFEMDPGEQTHLIQIGGGVVGTGYARNTVATGLTLFDVDGDAFRLLGGGLYGDAGECSGVRIMDCTFREIERACISHSRTCENIYITRNNFYGKTTSGQLIDYEPTGSEVHRGPRNNIISHNYFEAGRSDVAIFTLGGISPVDYMCHTGTLVAFNHCVGGRLDVGDTINLTVAYNRFVSGAVDDDANATAYFRGRSDYLKFIGNYVERPLGATPAAAFYIGQTNGGWPTNCTIQQNTFVTYVDTEAHGAVVRLNDCSDLDFSHNTVINRCTTINVRAEGEPIVEGIRYASTATSIDALPYKNINISHNTVKGAAGGGRLTDGIMVQANSTGEDITALRICFNYVTGAINQIAWDKGGSTVFATPPVCIGNEGEGPDFYGLSYVGQVLIAGSSGSQAIYVVNSGAPTFSAAKGAICIRRDGSAGSLTYVNTTGSTTWVATTDVADGVITNAKLATIATATFKGRTTAGTGVVEDLTVAQAAALLGLYFGTGDPEGVVTAPVSSVYRRTDGGAGTSLYVKESGAGNTGWVSL